MKRENEKPFHQRSREKRPTAMEAGAGEAGPTGENGNRKLMLLTTIGNKPTKAECLVPRDT